jgi:uncharacterized ferredoxin-like protein
MTDVLITDIIAGGKGVIKVMIIQSKDSERAAIMDVAQLMCAAARTAPKGCGVDAIETLIVTGEDKDAVAAEMRKIDEELHGDGPFGRDAGNVDASEAIVYIAVKNAPRGVPKCGHCGFGDCKGAAKEGAPCAFSIADLGIACGSAVSLAADHRIDNRIFFTSGVAAQRLKLFGDKAIIVYGIPLSTHGKSVYYDREKK